MPRVRVSLVLLAIPIIALAWWIHRRNTRPPEIPFATVQRETLISTLVTNGKVEPSDWVAARAERSGMVAKVHVEEGQRVARGALLVEFSDQDARTELSAAQAAVAQAQAELQTVQEGGRTSAQVEIENAIVRTHLDLEEARRNHEALIRLAEKQAATAQEAAEAGQRVQQLEAELKALERKRQSLVGQADRVAAEAALQEAEARRDRARALVERSRIHAPIAGVVYELAARPGAFLNAGDLVANVGNLQTLRVRVYVDEPELGRVSEGLPVSITWDALPGREWKGLVERTPTQVIPLGTRQVGEVICTIDNPDLELLPGTNVNAEIQSQVVQDGLTVPTEAVRRQDGQSGVYALDNDRVKWRDVRVGAASLTRVAILEGVSEGDRVALPTERVIHDGQPVRPVMR